MAGSPPGRSVAAPAVGGGGGRPQRIVDAVTAPDGHRFDNVVYDKDADVLYLAQGAPRADVRGKAAVT